MNESEHNATVETRVTYTEAVGTEKLLILIMRASESAGELRKSREAALVITKLDEARLWLEEYIRKNE